MPVKGDEFPHFVSLSSHHGEAQTSPQAGSRLSRARTGCRGDRLALATALLRRSRAASKHNELHRQTPVHPPAKIRT